MSFTMEDFQRQYAKEHFPQAHATGAREARQSLGPKTAVKSSRRCRRRYSPGGLVAGGILGGLVRRSNPRAIEPAGRRLQDPVAQIAAEAVTRPTAGVFFHRKRPCGSATGTTLAFWRMEAGAASQYESVTECITTPLIPSSSRATVPSLSRSIIRVMPRPATPSLPFAELEKSPEHIHTYRLTPLSLWNAAAAGMTADAMIDVLGRFSKFPLPTNLAADITELVSRYGRVKFERDGEHCFSASSARMGRSWKNWPASRRFASICKNASTRRLFASNRPFAAC